MARRKPSLATEPAIALRGAMQARCAIDGTPATGPRLFCQLVTTLLRASDDCSRAKYARYLERPRHSHRTLSRRDVFIRNARCNSGSAAVARKAAKFAARAVSSFSSRRFLFDGLLLNVPDVQG